jgi:hypothetical protein
MTNIAFFVRVEVTKGQGGEEVLPVTYSDNYITLLPGESATINAQYAKADLGGQPPLSGGKDTTYLSSRIQSPTSPDSSRQWTTCRC